MAKMAYIGKYFINTAHIVSAGIQNEAEMWIELDTGQMIMADIQYFENVMGVPLTME